MKHMKARFTIKKPETSKRERPSTAPAQLVLPFNSVLDDHQAACLISVDAS